MRAVLCWVARIRSHEELTLCRPFSLSLGQCRFTYCGPLGVTNPLRAARRGCELMNEDRSEPIVVPHHELSAEALRGVIESFVLREGTDYGVREYSLEEKVAHVMAQLQRGEARIEFDPNTATVGIVTMPGR